MSVLPQTWKCYLCNRIVPTGWKCQCGDLTEDQSLHRENVQGLQDRIAELEALTRSFAATHRQILARLRTLEKTTRVHLPREGETGR